MPWIVTITRVFAELRCSGGQVILPKTTNARAGFAQRYKAVSTYRRTEIGIWVSSLAKGLRGTSARTGSTQGSGSHCQSGVETETSSTLSTHAVTERLISTANVTVTR